MAHTPTDATPLAHRNSLLYDTATTDAKQGEQRLSKERLRSLTVQ